MEVLVARLSFTTNPGLGGLGIAFHQVFSITFPIPQPKGVVSKDKHVKVKKKNVHYGIKGTNELWK